MGAPRAIWPLASAIASLLVMAAPSAGGVFTRSPLQTVSVASTSPCEAIGHMASCLPALAGRRPEPSRVVSRPPCYRTRNVPCWPELPLPA
jgi:hypothetical protein